MPLIMCTKFQTNQIILTLLSGCGIKIPPPPPVAEKAVGNRVKVEYLENGLTDFNDFGFILQDFEMSFR